MIKEGPFYYGIDKLADSAVVCIVAEEQNRHSVRRALNKEVKLVFDNRNQYTLSTSYCASRNFSKIKRIEFFYFKLNKKYL